MDEIVSVSNQKHFLCECGCTEMDFRPIGVPFKDCLSNDDLGKNSSFINSLPNKYDALIDSFMRNNLLVICKKCSFGTTLLDNLDKDEVRRNIRELYGGEIHS